MSQYKNSSEKTTNKKTSSNIIISVIIPIFNAEKYLEQCITSIERQTFKELEIICIDDGSADNSLGILKKHAQKDNRIHIIEKKHTNAGESRNEGLNYATGQYIAFVDADDYVEPNMIETAYNIALELSADIVHFRCNMWDETLNEYKECPWTLKDWEMPDFRPFSATDAADKLFNMGSCTPWDKLFKRQFIIDNNIIFQNVTTCDDIVFTYSAMSKAECITTSDEILYHQRVGHRKYLAENIEKTISNFYVALSGLKSFLVERGIYETYKKSFLNWATDFSLWFYNIFELPLLHGLIGQNLKWNYLENLGIYELAEEDYYNHDLFEQISSLRLSGVEISKKIKNYTPEVSVIIPLYNAGTNFQMCLESIIHQTFTDLEIVLVTEKGDPESQKLANEAINTDIRIVIIENENSFSHSGAVNTGIINAKGKYLTIVEPFDLVDVTMIEKLYFPAKKHELDYAKGDVGKLNHDEYGNIHIIPRNTAQNHNNYNKVINSSYDRRWKNFYKSPWCTLYRKNFIVENELLLPETYPALYIDEDYIFKINITAEKVMYIPDILYFDTEKSYLLSGYSMTELL